MGIELIIQLIPIFILSNLFGRTQLVWFPINEVWKLWGGLLGRRYYENEDSSIVQGVVNGLDEWGLLAGLVNVVASYEKFFYYLWVNFYQGCYYVH